MKNSIKSLHGKKVMYHQKVNSRLATLKFVIRQLKDQGCNDYHLKDDTLNFGSQFMFIPKKGAHKPTPAYIQVKSNHFVILKIIDGKINSNGIRCESSYFKQTSNNTLESSNSIITY